MKKKEPIEKGYNKLMGWYTCGNCMCHHQGEHRCDGLIKMLVGLNQTSSIPHVIKKKSRIIKRVNNI